MVIVGLLATAQAIALVVLLQRLSRGRNRPPAVEPVLHGLGDSSVSVVIPARNEAARIGPCLAGISAQEAPMVDALVIDGGSTDGTAVMIDRASVRDHRIRRLVEPPKPAGAVGRPWAIATGCDAARSEWILVVDADTIPKPGMVAGAVAAARRGGYDVVSFAPRILAPSAGARWLQPAFLTTLVYRFGPVGIDAKEADRAMANGQCLLIRRAALEAAGGYGVASGSYCDDIRIVRHLAASGARVGFLDGRKLFDVTMYPTAAETWRAWPRSLNMRDATTSRWRLLDGVFLAMTMVLPVPMLLLLAFAAAAGAPVAATSAWLALFIVNAGLLATSALLLVVVRPSFAEGGPAFWLSPFAQPAAAMRVIATTIERPREWRGSLRPLAPAVTAATAGSAEHADHPGI